MPLLEVRLLLSLPTLLLVENVPHQFSKAFAGNANVISNLSSSSTSLKQLSSHSLKYVGYTYFKERRHAVKLCFVAGSRRVSHTKHLLQTSSLWLTFFIILWFSRANDSSTLQALVAGSGIQSLSVGVKALHLRPRSMVPTMFIVAAGSPGRTTLPMLLLFPCLLLCPNM